ncbi:hypothetical protein [Sphingomonas sp. CFBP 13706]|uniref:hypothetical protein n=1 Tax=Sphingomonas sp. CFBP 13706 TaxID=2775314 RepID=UPI00177B1DF8|nr:hypothetical protein [Sphingomonas sp. CFBP 13706]MBD8736209.1 hypothetical protein [Sphingomonas sp. CFBP 13706]
MEETMEALAYDQVDAAAARDVVWTALDSQVGFREAYSALCRWTWRAMVERRLDDDLRSWHRLLLDAAGKLAGAAPAATPRTRARSRLEPAAAAERLRALADMVRLSIDAAAASIPTELGKRAHVLEILRFLTERVGEHVEREQIKKAVGLEDANLSRVLTLMTANSLVERLPLGKVASFRATQHGLALVTAPDPKERERARVEMPHPPMPDLDRGKRAHFEPLTVVKYFGGDGAGDRDVTGPVDHEPTYRPPKIMRGPSAFGSRRSPPLRIRELVQ